MALHCFDRASLPSTPWKNGGGITREIVCMPEGADLDLFDWRISIAEVASDGPFSSFQGIDRVITLLEGAGMRLSSNDGDANHLLVKPLEPWAFPGEMGVHSTLLGDVCHDFNVMVRRQRYRTTVTPLRGLQALEPSFAGLLLACGGPVHAELDDGRSFSLDQDQGVWWTDELLHWQIKASPEATLLGVALHKVGNEQI